MSFGFLHHKLCMLANPPRLAAGFGFGSMKSDSLACRTWLSNKGRWPWGSLRKSFGQNYDSLYPRHCQPLPIAYFYCQPKILHKICVRNTEQLGIPDWFIGKEFFLGHKFGLHRFRIIVIASFWALGMTKVNIIDLHGIILQEASHVSPLAWDVLNFWPEIRWESSFHWPHV